MSKVNLSSEHVDLLKAHSKHAPLAELGELGIRDAIHQDRLLESCRHAFLGGLEYLLLLILRVA